LCPNSGYARGYGNNEQLTDIKNWLFVTIFKDYQIEEDPRTDE